MHAYPFLRVTSVLHLSAVHVTSMLYLLTAVSVCGYLEEIFLVLHTCLLVLKVTCSLIDLIVP